MATQKSNAKKFVITQTHLKEYKTAMDGCYAEIAAVLQNQENPQDEAKQWKLRLNKDGAQAYDKIMDARAKLSSTQLSPSKTKIVIDVPIDRLAEFMLDITKAKLYDSYYNGTQHFADLTKYMNYEPLCKPRESEKELVTQTRLLHMRYKGFLVVGPRDFLYLSSFKKLSATTTVIATISVEHEGFVEYKGHTRGHMGNSGIILQSLSPMRTHITNVGEVDLKGWVPKEAVKAFTQAEEYNMLLRAKRTAEAWFKSQPVEAAPELPITAPQVNQSPVPPPVAPPQATEQPPEGEKVAQEPQVAEQPLESEKVVQEPPLQAAEQPLESEKIVPITTPQEDPSPISPPVAPLQVTEQPVESETTAPELPQAVEQPLESEKTAPEPPIASPEVPENDKKVEEVVN